MRTITEAPCRGAGEHEFPTSRCREPDARRRRDVGWSRKHESSGQRHVCLGGPEDCPVRVERDTDLGVSV